MCYLTKLVPLPSHIKVSAPLIIITCIFHSVFVTENKLSIMNQVFSINKHWKYGLYFDIATSSVSNEHSSILYCIMINQQAVWNMKSWWIICGNSYSTRTFSSTTFSFIAYFPDELCLVVIDFSANTDWTQRVIVGLLMAWHPRLGISSIWSCYMMMKWGWW